MYKNSKNSSSPPSLIQLLHKRPSATAYVRGNRDYPDIIGIVRFYQTDQGVLTLAEISGLPQSNAQCAGRFFGFHIHEGPSCTGNDKDPFADALTHYNPYGCSHPYHAGDLPPILGNRGVSLSMCMTDRFSVREIIGKTVIIHDRPDDFTTQPSGNSGQKIACGKIVMG